MLPSQESISYSVNGGAFGPYVPPERDGVYHVVVRRTSAQGLVEESSFSFVRGQPQVGQAPTERQVRSPLVQSAQPVQPAKPVQAKGSVKASEAVMPAQTALTAKAKKLIEAPQESPKLASKPAAQPAPSTPSAQLAKVTQPAPTPDPAARVGPVQAAVPKLQLQSQPLVMPLIATVKSQVSDLAPIRITQSAVTDTPAANGASSSPSVAATAASQADSAVNAINWASVSHLMERGERLSLAIRTQLQGLNTEPAAHEALESLLPILDPTFDPTRRVPDDTMAFAPIAFAPEELLGIHPEPLSGRALQHAIAALTQGSHIPQPSPMPWRAQPVLPRQQGATASPAHRGLEIVSKGGDRYSVLRQHSHPLDWGVAGAGRIPVLTSHQARDCMRADSQVVFDPNYGPTPYRIEVKPPFDPYHGA